MRVEEDIWHHPAFSEGYILSWPQPAQDAFLSMSAGKLVPNGWVSGDSQSDANTFEFSRSSVIAAYFDVIHNTDFPIPGGEGKNGLNKQTLYDVGKAAGLDFCRGGRFINDSSI